MSKNKILQPKIRFKEFSGENAEAWEQRKLGEVSNIVGGGTPSTSTPEFWDGDINWFSPVEIGDQRYLYNSNRKITLLGLQKSSAKLLPINSVLFTSRAGIGNTAILKKEATTNQGFQSIVPIPEKLDTYFIYSMTPYLKKYGEKHGAGSTFVEISGKEMQKMSIFLPSISEQVKIGNLFKDFDDAITLHQRKLETLESLKKTLLSKMFPKNGKAVPELRFAGFTDNWEQRKASELFKSISDKNHPNLPVLSASQEKGMILRDDIGIDIKYDHKSLSNYKRVTPGQFVIHLRSFQGGFADSQMEGITSPAYTVIDFKEKDQSHSLFWKEILTSQSFIKRLETVTYGIRDGRSISFSDFSTLKFIVPKLDEQEKIAVLFKILNQTITLHQRKIEQYQELKKTLLSKMFI